MSFVNCSNHPSGNWSESQRQAAQLYGPIVDVPFPAVDPHFSKREVNNLALCLVEEILSLNPAVVLCQGEMTLTFAAVTLLKAAGVSVVAACSERRSTERQNENGETIRESRFVFWGFREY